VFGNSFPDIGNLLRRWTLARTLPLCRTTPAFPLPADADGVLRRFEQRRQVAAIDVVAAELLTGTGGGKSPDCTAFLVVHRHGYCRDACTQLPVVHGVALVPHVVEAVEQLCA